MLSTDISIEIAASPEAVWSELSDIARHGEWMSDAVQIDFETDQRTGKGTRVRILTRVGPLRTSDLLEVTDWVAPRRIAVRHHGRVTGSGEFLISPGRLEGSFLSWREELSFPWFFGGVFGEWVAKPILARTFRRNLQSLRARVEAPETG